MAIIETKFKLGQKVKTTRHPQGGIDGYGIIYSISTHSETLDKASVQYSIRHQSGAYSYFESSLKEIKVQTLFGYKDSTDEVHWSTRKYTSGELADFGFVEAFEFNKEFDLE